jgi:hypothetical protein
MQIATARSRSDLVKVAVDFSPRKDRPGAWRRGATLETAFAQLDKGVQPSLRDGSRSRFGPWTSVLVITHKFFPWIDGF